MNILKQILEVKQQEMEKINPFMNEIEPCDTMSFKNALSVPGISVIAEIKMKSPSEGNILPNADPVQIAKDYQSAGAQAISILTDEHFFGGNIGILEAVKKAVSIPVLRKDFIIDNHQIMEAGAAGADAFLLIAEALDMDSIQSFIDFGNGLHLEALVEFHSHENAELVANLSPDIVGVNCRNLNSMDTDIKHFERMSPLLPEPSIKVAESGIRSWDDLQYVSDLGYDAVLVGTSLMKTKNPGKALETLLGGAS